MTARLRTVGSSDAAAILGLSPWQTPWSVWARLVGLTERDSGGSPATRRGNMLEAAILQRWARENERAIVPGPSIDADPILHPTEPWRSCRPDAVTADRPDIIIEAKSARYLDEADGWGESGTDCIPRHYAIQVIWQMATLGIDFADLAAFGTVKDDWRVYHLERRPALEEAIVGRVRDWYQRYVVTETPPPVDGSDDCSIGLGLLYREPDTRVTVERTDADLEMARELATCREQIKQWEAAKERLENELKARIGNAYALEGIATWGVTAGRSSIDAKALAKAHPDIAAEFTRAGKPGRTFRFTYDADKETA